MRAWKPYRLLLIASEAAQETSPAPTKLTHPHGREAARPMHRPLESLISTRYLLRLGDLYAVFMRYRSLPPRFLMWERREDQPRPPGRRLMPINIPQSGARLADISARTSQGARHVGHRPTGWWHRLLHHLDRLRARL